VSREEKATGLGVEEERRAFFRTGAMIDGFLLACLLLFCPLRLLFVVGTASLSLPLLLPFLSLLLLLLLLLPLCFSFSFLSILSFLLVVCWAFLSLLAWSASAASSSSRACRRTFRPLVSRVP